MITYIYGLLHDDRPLRTVARHRMFVATSSDSVAAILSPQRSILQLNADRSIRIHPMRLTLIAL